MPNQTPQDYQNAAAVGEFVDAGGHVWTIRTTVVTASNTSTTSPYLTEGVTWETSVTGYEMVYNGEQWVPTLTPPTPEEMRQRQLAFDRKARRYQKRQRIAEIRAQRLLDSLLDDDQREDYAISHAFTVRVRKPHWRTRTFRILYGSVGNVHEYIAGAHVRSYCIAPRAGVPIEDVMVAQKLMIENDLPAFERIANHI